MINVKSRDLIKPLKFRYTLKQTKQNYAVNAIVM